MHVINDTINSCVVKLSYRFNVDTAPEYILDGLRMTIEIDNDVLMYFNDIYVDDDTILHLFIPVQYEEPLSVDKVLMPPPTPTPIVTIPIIAEIKQPTPTETNPVPPPPPIPTLAVPMYEVVPTLP